MNFDIETQRGLVCLSGLVGLLIQLVAHVLAGVNPSDLLTGAFLTMTVSPVIQSIIQRYKENKKDWGDPPDSRGGDTEPPEEEPRGPSLRLVARWTCA